MQLMKIIFLLLISSKFCYSQKQEMEELLSQVINREVPTSFHYFNLVDTSGKLYLDTSSFNEPIFRNLTLKKYPDFNVADFYNITDTEKVNWKFYKLSRSNIQSRNLIPKYETGYRTTKLISRKLPKTYIDSIKRTLDYNEIVVIYGKSWSEKRKKKKVHLKWKKHDSKIKEEDKVYYIFSKPIFSKDRHYSIIQIDTGSTRTIDLYKKVDGKWIWIYTIFSLTS